MALLESEVYRAKFELGYNLLTIGSEPWIDHVAVFDQVIKPYLYSGASTTSSTAVVAGTDPTPVTLTLADATGFAAGAIVVIDVDSRQERVTVENLVGTAMTVLLSKAHSGTYPVTMEGGETIIRSILARLRDMDDKSLAAAGTAGLKSVGRGAVEWYGTGSASLFSTLQSLKDDARDDLAYALGIPNMRSYGRGCMSIY